ncbi:pyridoxamine 5'-phosphate oxidase family protein [Novosphingobium sp. 9]|uniref:pyridoxamine 5'-phosphate oxidase family protein n=1 Tax=Novosphingobium sp. 9 TaxID=2025349 RepID=UPI0021B54409|nr:pyridoxamine 5'-phosphate oxidase family protein [Novosphingobium sp. 9]
MDDTLRDTFWRAFAASPFLMIKRTEAPGHAEPMTALLDREAHHALWFFAARTNRIAAGGAAMAQIMTKDHDVFACLSGTLVEETDPAVRARHWSNAVEAWFPDGETDTANVPMLRLDIADAEVWTADMGLKGAFKLLTGKPLNPADAGAHATGPV